MLVYFVRHGESEANVLNVFSNRGTKHPLTSRGREQVEMLAGKLADATAKHGKSLGRLVPNVETGIEYNKRWGFDFICYSGDVWVLHNALAEAVSKLRAECKGSRGGGKAKKGKKK